MRPILTLLACVVIAIMAYILLSEVFSLLVNICIIVVLLSLFVWALGAVIRAFSKEKI